METPDTIHMQELNMYFQGSVQTSPVSPLRQDLHYIYLPGLYYLSKVTYNS